MAKTIRDMLADTDGATLIEYALVVSLIAVVAILVITKLGTGASTLLSSGAASI